MPRWLQAIVLVLLTATTAAAQSFVRLQPVFTTDTISADADSVVLTTSNIGTFGSVKIQTLDSYTGTWEVQCSVDGTNYDTDNELKLQAADSVVTVYSVSDEVGIWDVTNAAACRAIKVIATAGFAATDTLVVVSATQSGGGTGSGGGGGGEVTVTDGTDTALVSAGGELLVSCADCSGSGVSHVDDAAFTVGTDDVVPFAGIYRSTLDTVNDGDAGAVAILSNRILMAHIVDSAGATAVLGGGTQYTEGDTDTTITGTAMLMEGAANALVVAQGTATDGLLVNLGANNDVTVTSISAGDNNIGNVDIATLPNVTIGTFPNNEPFDVALWAGTTATGGAGTVTAGTPRMTLASNDPAVASLQTIDNMMSGNGINVTQLGSASVPIGAGTEAAAIRVTLPTNGTGVVTANAGTDLNTSLLAVDASVDEVEALLVGGLPALLAVTGGLKVDIVGFNGVAPSAEIADEGTFTYTTTTVVPIGYVAESTTDAIADGKLGAPVMTLSRLARAVPSPYLSGGGTGVSYISAGATEDEHAVCTGPCTVYNIVAMNHTAASAFLRCENDTAANTTPGSETNAAGEPDLEIPAASGLPGGFAINLNVGVSFDTALTCWIVSGEAASNTDEVAASDVRVWYVRAQ